MKLIIRALMKFLSGLILLGCLLFLQAGTFAYYNAWVFIALLFIPMLLVGIYLIAKDKALLEKRLKMNESEKEQKRVIIITSLQFVLCFAIAGFDFRFHWSNVPVHLTVAAGILLLISYGLYIEIMRENAYLSRTVEIQEDQKVVDKGLYGIVRHPMYFATILLYWSMPLVLGSWFALVIMLPYPWVIARRILNEESVLENGLAGYKEYEQKVKYRLIPYIW